MCNDQNRRYLLSMKILINTKKILAVILLLIFVFSNTYPQITTLEPDKPKFDDTLKVIYNPQAEGAKFSLNDEVYMVGFLYRHHESRSIWKRMEKQDTLFESEIYIKPGLSFVSFHFITLTDWDKSVSLSTMIYRDNGLPAKGALQRKMYHSDIQLADSLFYKEISLYPDNYSAYRDKWFMANLTQKSRIDSIVRADMKVLAAKVKGEPVGYLYAMAYGYLLLKQEEKSRSIIKKLIERYPISPLTGQALDNYEYLAFANQLKGEGPMEIKELKRKYIISFPNTRYAREQIRILAKEEDFPLDVVEKICLLWQKEQPDHPWPYYSLATAYFAHHKKLDKASQLMDKAITLMVQGKLRFYEDISGGITKMTLPRAYVRRAKIAKNRKNYAAAIAYLKTAQSLKIESYPKAYLTEAKIWQELSISPKAESAYFRAWREGSVEAEDSLRKIYIRKHGNLSDFDTYLKKFEEQSAINSSTKTPAPAFHVISLNGEKLDLDALRGKVVVLNFWFIGCAPCRVEIPGLNKLVEEFKDQDVVFIGFALNNEKELKKFLRNTRFKYHIIAKSGKIAQKYQVTGYPTHIIIDKNGFIQARLTGGNENRHEDLKPIIARLIKK